MDSDTTHGHGHGVDKYSVHFVRLVLTFQTAAMQQMGKLVDPESGTVLRDLQQAAASIDMLDMLRVRCSGNLSDDEEHLLKGAISELKLNYIDEIGRPDPTPQDTETSRMDQAPSTEPPPEGDGDRNTANDES